MKKCVHVDSQFYPHDRTAEIETLKEHGIELVMAKIQKGDDEGFIEACKGADAVIVCYADANRNVLSHLPDLKIVVRTGVGFENVDVDAATDYNIAACNIPHFCTQEVAVTACTHILNCVRRVSYENKLVHGGGHHFRPRAAFGCGASHDRQRAAQSPESWVDMVDQVIESVIIGIDRTLPANALNRKALAEKRGKQE